MSFTLNFSAPSLVMEWASMENQDQQIQFLARHGQEDEVRTAFFAEESAVSDLVTLIISDGSPDETERRLSALFALLKAENRPSTPVEEACRNKVLNQGGLVAALGKMLRTEGFSRESTLYATGILHSLARSAQGRKEIMKVDGLLQPLITLLDGKVDELASKVRIEVLGVLMSVMCALENQSRLAQFPGLISSVAGILHSASPNLNEKQSAAIVFRFLAWGHSDNQRLLGLNPSVLSGLVSLIGMDNPRNTFAVRVPSLTALARIGFDADIDTQRRLANFPKLLESVMDIFHSVCARSSEKEAATYLLLCLSVNKAPSENKKLLAGNLRVMEGLVNCMKLDDPKNTSAVRGNTLTVLSSIGSDPDTQSRVANFPRLIESVADILHAPMVSPKEKENAARVIVSLIENHPENQKKIGSLALTIVPALVAQLRDASCSPIPAADALINLYGRADSLEYPLKDSEKLVEYLCFALLRVENDSNLRFCRHIVGRFARHPYWEPKFQAASIARFLVADFREEGSSSERQAFSDELIELGILPDQSLREERFNFLTRILFAESVTSTPGDSVPAPISPLIAAVFADARMRISGETAEAADRAYQVVSEYAGMVAMFL